MNVYIREQLRDMFFVLGGQYVCIINIELPLFRVYLIKMYGTTNSSYLIQNCSDEKLITFIV